MASDTAVFAAIDAQYLGSKASVACVTFSDWGSATPDGEFATTLDQVEEYQSGEFWRREVPCALAALELLDEAPTVIVVDGYVWLDSNGRKGMGAHLFDALNGAAAVVGVAKTAFVGSDAGEVLRGESQRPLFVTAAGLPMQQARRGIASMHGEFRIPTLLQRADRLCRQGIAAMRVLPVVALHVGPELRLIGDAALSVGPFDDEVRALIRRLSGEQRTLVRGQIASMWKQFDPDAAYVLAAPDGTAGLEFTDDLELMRWVKWVESEIGLDDT